MSEENNSEIIYKYNEIKQKYTVFFQKALELEDELREHKYFYTLISLKSSCKYFINCRKK
jgi:hypothetical protein